MIQTLYHLHTISALHVGIGQGTGIIDLPIAREKASNLPQIPGSAIKGVLRDEMRGQLKDKSRKQLEEDDLLALFGPETGETASEYAGALAVGDARLLCLPIRSWQGTFAWASCPMILRRYQRDLKNDNSIPVPTENSALHCQDTRLKDGNMIYLEDLDLETEYQQETEAWAEVVARAFFADDDWQNLFKQRFVILTDDVFDFLAETATEIRARIRIEEGTRTVQSGALWYEEYLPAETLLWGCIASDRPRKKDYKREKEDMLALLPASERLQIGGNATIGAGQVRWILQPQEQAKQA
ncbi:MAG: type III-B CRISPR module RAMP protein Cmr4 [Methylococcaceae bacterium]